MPSEKRKHVAEESSRKSSNKRSKPDLSTKQKAPKSEKNGDKDKPQPVHQSSKPKIVSILTKEQPAFPRGGTDVLTPLERKQIHARASRDAAKEFNKSGDLFGDNQDENIGSSEHEDEDLPQDSSRVKKAKGLRKQKKSKDSATKEAQIKIGGLNFKRIATGSLILGQIIEIGPRDITVALPNNLVGYVPLTAISPQLSQKLHSLLNEVDTNDQSSNSEQEEHEDIVLTDYFQMNQYLRVCVTSTGEVGDGTKSSSRKHLELSIEPSMTNSGLSRSSLTSGCSVQVSVASVEDHGIVVDLALEGEQIRGFVPIASLPDDVPLTIVKPGSVFLCNIVSVGSNGKIVKLSAKTSTTGVMKNAPAVDSFLPGSLAEILTTEVNENGLAGKVIGMIDVTADVVHSGLFSDRDAFLNRYEIGQKVQGRIICNFPLSEGHQLGFSVLQNLMNLESPPNAGRGGLSLKLSSKISDASVVSVDPGLGVYLALNAENIGFAHISRLSDKRLESISESSGSYRVGSQHDARILDFNPIDGLYILSLQQSILEQPYLRVDDVQIGEVVKGTIEKLVLGPTGFQGIIVKISENVTGFVSQSHTSDVILQHPEKKFREGQSVTARVLSVNQFKRRIQLTFKKTLVNSDQKIWSNFQDVAVGDSTVGTLIKVDPHGALVQFYGPVKGFLPVSEMSEAYIKDATEHFRVGQTVTVSAISVNSTENRLTISCRDVNSTTPSLENTLSSLIPGTLAHGTVFEKSQVDLLLRLEKSDAIARLTIDQISDGSLRKRQSTLDKIRVGQRLENILILEVQVKRRLVLISNKQSLINASQSGTLIKGFEDVQQEALVVGFVSNITPDGIFVSFASGISGLVTKRQVLEGSEDQPDFGVVKYQTISAKILSIDYKGAVPRFWLTMRDLSPRSQPLEPVMSTSDSTSSQLIDAVDVSIKDLNEIMTGKVTQARITSVKATQLNVELAKGIQGRVDVSEVFDKWEDIKDQKKPLQGFAPKQIIPVRVLGAHDTRNHRFLPLSHRSSKNTVYELTAKSSSLKSENFPLLSLDDMTIGSSWLAFVNNLAEDCLWVNISPSVRGRIRVMDISDDLSLAADLEANFPLGSALQVQVLGVDGERNRLDLTARGTNESRYSVIQDVSKGLVLSGRVTRITDRNVLVQFSDTLIGAIELIDMADDYSKADPTRYTKNDIIKVCVVHVDIPNKRISLSARPSKVLSSSLKVRDPEITSIEQLKINDVFRGFITNVTDKGIFILIGHAITGFVRVSNLSDSFLKDWKDHFQRDQLVTGKIISVDKASGHVQMSLKESVMKVDYRPPLMFSETGVGDILTGKIAKVESFGVFVRVDNSENVRGLCHRSEMAEQKVEDPSKIFSEGDAVKVKVLKVDSQNRRINFGMKASYFVDSSEDTDEDLEEDDEDKNRSDLVGELDLDGLVAQAATAEQHKGESGLESEGDGENSDLQENEMGDDNAGNLLADISNLPPGGLKVGGFDWYGISESGNGTKRSGNTSDTDDDRSTEQIRKKKRKRAEIQIDRTGDLDANGPQSVDDYERLLLGEPDSSLLWLQYMAFHLELGDIDQARQIGERALISIGLGQDAEKMNVWMALLNLENAYGDDETIENIFKRACEYNEPQEIHSRLTSIYIQSGKQDKADDMFQKMVKKFAQKDPKIWINYATYLFDTVADAERARALLPRALKILPKFTHFDLTLKFAQMEFKSSAGLPERGRTIFEGLISAFPKRIDVFKIMLDLELKVGNTNKEQIRDLFERIITIKKLKAKQAKYFFKRWMAYEEQNGDERKAEDVQAKAAAWLRAAGKAS